MTEQSVAACRNKDLSEALLLGAMMSRHALISRSRFRAKLQPQHFGDGLHALIYRCMLRLADGHFTATPDVLSAILSGSDELQKNGGTAYLAYLNSLAPTGLLTPEETALALASQDEPLRFAEAANDNAPQGLSE